MDSILTLKEQEILQTPLLLFECRLRNGHEEYWSTHQISHDGRDYEPRVVRHNALESRSLSDEGIDAMARVSVSLANTDSHFSQLDRNVGWKGARLTIRFGFFDLETGLAASEIIVLFQGVANPPEEITESSFRIGFANRLGLQRVLLPQVRIERRCPWTFPTTEEQRVEAIDGGEQSRYSAFFRCGYSAGLPNGVGNLDGGAPFTSCGYTRQQCEERGMFRQDQAGNPTRRFGGVEFLPASILVRSHDEKGAHVSATAENRARYNDFIPLVYGTAWYEPPIVFARNDGNLTHTEVLLGLGEIQSVLKVIVNNIEIPEGQDGSDMTATGWYNLVSVGNRTGDFNHDFQDEAGNNLGDPYGSMAYLSVVVPNHINDGRALPRIQVLLEGLKLERFDATGTYQGIAFSNNPAWVLLDLLRRCGWSVSEIDLASFGKTAEHCEEPITANNLYGDAVQIPRYQCNLVVQKRRSAADLIRGVRSASGLYLTYGAGGLLELHPESTLAVQQAAKPAFSNSTETLNGGWPAYEFGDGSNGFSGILRRENGEPAIRLWSRPTAETPNRYSVEFQDAFNEYQQDSLSLVDVGDALVSGQEVSARLNALGLPNFNQAGRIIQRQLNRGLKGNLYVDFETSVRAFGIKPGDLISLTYLKEGFQRQPFRVIRVSVGPNHRQSLITCQLHDEAWYPNANPQAGSSQVRRQLDGQAGLPRPLVGDVLDEFGRSQFSISESSLERTDGSIGLRLTVGFVEPRVPDQTGVGIPMVSLAADVESTGGSLAGGEKFYYAVSGVDGAGKESGLSFVVRAAIPAGTSTNRVTLRDLSFSNDATAFHVYRGDSPIELLRIASDVPIAGEFTDDGLGATLAGPPDPNFDHARFYWRLEKVPEYSATSFSHTSVGSDILQMIPDEHAGMTVRISRGKGEGQERVILSNDSTVITVTKPWGTDPDATSHFVVVEPSWSFGAVASTSPVEFEVPNRAGATVHISGRAVNAQGRESCYELSPITRWTIGGDGAGQIDSDVAGRPIFGLYPAGNGTVEVVGVGFTEFENTRTIQAGTLSVHYWGELNSPTTYSLATSLGDQDTIVALNTAGTAQIGGLIQVGAEVMVVEEVLDGGLRYEVTRGSHNTTVGTHAASTELYHLDRKVFVIPFVHDFFGSPASGSFSYPIHLPDVRIAAAEFFVTNSRGNSESARNAFTSTIEEGLRTLSGGQLSLQVEGYLAIETNAAPPLVIEASHSVRDVFAVVQDAPTGAPVELQIQQDGEIYCDLTIPAGETISNVVSGFGLPPLREKSELTLHILAVGQTSDTTPGNDLTVTIRL